MGDDIKEKQEFRFALAFGYGFITLMFLGFGCGYLLGRFVFELNEVGSLILSLIMGIGTLIVEAILMLIKMNKLEA